MKDSMTISDQLRTELTEVVDNMFSLDQETITARFFMFEEAVKKGQIDETDKLYIRMHMMMAQFASLNKDFARSHELLSHILDIAHKQDNQQLKIMTRNNQAALLSEQGKIFEAIDIWEDLLSNATTFQDKIRYYRNLGVAYAKGDKQEKALEMFFRTLEELQDKDLPDDIADTNNSLGNSYRSTKNYPKAMECYQIALENYEKSGNNQRMAMVYSNMIACSNDSGNSGLADSFTELALEYYHKYQPPGTLATLLNNIGVTMINLERWDDAISYFTQAYEYACQYPDVYIQMASLNNLADTYVRINDYDSAIKYTDQALRIARKEDHQNGILSSFYILKEAYLALKDYPKAADIIEKAFILYQELEDKNPKLFLAKAEADFLQRKLEKQLEIYRLQNIELNHSNRMLNASNILMNRMIAIMSHDVRGPIGAITQMLELMNHGHVDTSEHQEILHELHNSAKQTYRLVNELLDVTKKYDAGLEDQPERLNLCAEISDVIKIMASTASVKQLKLHFEHQTHRLMVHISKNRIRLILRNLLANAIKFSHPHQDIVISLVHDDSTIRISVQDHGIGMSKDKIERILKGSAFSSPGTQEEKGFGLGMVFVLESVRISKGTLELTSELGKGSTFSIIYEKADLIKD